MFNNCGKTLKAIARVFFILCLVAAFIVLIAELADANDYLLGSVAATVIVDALLIVSGIVGAPMIYGFGEIIGCVKEIRDQTNK